MPSRPNGAVAKLDQVLEDAIKVGEDMEWNDLFHSLGAAGHPDLPGVFRRIAAAVSHTKKARLAFFYCAAAETFDLQRSELLGEVAANFRRLDGKSYDPDALKHLTEILLAAGRTQDALDLLSHFWPILRRDRGLMGWVVPETADAIIELQIGLLHADPAHTLDSTEALVRQVTDGLGSGVDQTMVAASIGIMWGRREEPPWSKSDFEYPRTQCRPHNVWDEEDEDDPDTPTAGKRKKCAFPELEVEPLWLAARYAAAESVRLGRHHSDTALYDSEMSCGHCRSGRASRMMAHGISWTYCRARSWRTL